VAEPVEAALRDRCLFGVHYEESHCAVGDGERQEEPLDWLVDSEGHFLVHEMNDLQLIRSLTQLV